MGRDRKEKAMRCTRGGTGIGLGLVGASLLALATLAGCASSGVERSAQAQASMAEFRNQTTAFRTSLAATIASLESLQKNAKVDPKKEYEGYVKNLDATLASAESAKSTVAQMKSQGQAYFGEWEKQAATISNEDIRKLSEERRAKLRTNYQRLEAALDEVATDAKPLRERLESLRAYYSQDLTPAGIAASEDLVDKAKDEAASLEKKLAKVMEELDEVAGELKVATPPPPPPEPAKKK
jgi:hypothetical protein